MMHHLLDRFDRRHGTQFAWIVARSNQLPLRQQTNTPQPHQRPVDFQLGVFRRMAPKLATPEGLLERSEEYFHAPTRFVNLRDLPIAQTRLAQHIGQQTHRLFAIVNPHGAQHQRPP
jgi:hypothetical protein